MTTGERGKFIVFEGLDGCGSTTQADLLKRWFDSREQPAYYTKEPTEGPIGSVIRLCLSKRIGSPRADQLFEPLDEATLALAFAADRMDHLRNEIIPKLETGITVLADRYYLSSLAYQSVEVDYQWLKEINSQCLRPDLTVFLDVPPVVCKKRMEKQRRHVELYEEIPKLEKVRQNYYRAIQDLIQQGEVIRTIDGNRPIQGVHKDVISLVKSLLTKGRLPPQEKQLSLGDDSLRVDEGSVSVLKEC